MDRKYLPTLSELIDRLSINQLKEVFLDKDKKEKYTEEIKDIMHDIDIILQDKTKQIGAITIRAIIVLAQINLHIWHNESAVRAGTGDGNLELTHGLNGIRNTAKNKIEEIIGGRIDYKIDCLAADFDKWEISW